MAGSIPADPSRMLDQEASTMGGGFLNTNFMASTAKGLFNMTGQLPGQQHHLSSTRKAPDYHMPESRKMEDLVKHYYYRMTNHHEFAARANICLKSSTVLSLTTPLLRRMLIRNLSHQVKCLYAVLELDDALHLIERHNSDPEREGIQMIVLELDRSTQNSAIRLMEALRNRGDHAIKRQTPLIPVMMLMHSDVDCDEPLSDCLEMGLAGYLEESMSNEEYLRFFLGDVVRRYRDLHVSYQTVRNLRFFKYPFFEMNEVEDEGGSQTHRGKHKDGDDSTVSGESWTVASDLMDKGNEKRVYKHKEVDPSLSTRTGHRGSRYLATVIKAKVLPTLQFFHLHELSDPRARPRIYRNAADHSKMTGLPAHTKMTGALVSPEMQVFVQKDMPQGDLNKSSRGHSVSKLQRCPGFRDPWAKAAKEREKGYQVFRKQSQSELEAGFSGGSPGPRRREFQDIAGEENGLAALQRSPSRDCFPGFHVTTQQKTFKDASSGVVVSDVLQYDLIVPEPQVVTSKSVNSFVLRGFKCHVQNELSKALSFFQYAIQLEPSATGYFYRAVTHDAQGDYLRALQDFNQAHKYNSTSPEFDEQVILYNRAVVASKLGMDHYALADLYKATKMDKTDVLFLTNRAMIHRRHGQFHAACEHYRNLWNIKARALKRMAAKEAASEEEKRAKKKAAEEERQQRIETYRAIAAAAPRREEGEEKPGVETEQPRLEQPQAEQPPPQKEGEAAQPASTPAAEQPTPGFRRVRPVLDMNSINTNCPPPPFVPDVGFTRDVPYSPLGPPPPPSPMSPKPTFRRPSMQPFKNLKSSKVGLANGQDMDKLKDKAPMPVGPTHTWATRGPPPNLEALQDEATARAEWQSIIQNRTTIFEGLCCKPSDLQEALGRIPSERSEQDVEHIQAAMSMFPLLYGLDKEVIRELARATEYRLVSEGKFVCVHGHAPDACFLILRGKVSVKLHNSDETNVHIYTLKERETFGEMALVDAQRPFFLETYVCETNCELLLILKDEFDRLLHRHVFNKLKQRYVAMRKLHIFQSWSMDHLTRLARMGQVRSIPADTVILKQTEPPQCMYVLLRGAVNVSKQPSRVAELQYLKVSIEQQVTRIRTKYSYHHSIKPPARPSTAPGKAGPATSRETPRSPMHSARKPAGVASPRKAKAEADKPAADASKELLSLTYKTVTEQKKQELLKQLAKVDEELKGLGFSNKELEEMTLLSPRTARRTTRSFHRQPSADVQVRMLTPPALFGEECVLDPQRGVALGSFTAETRVEVLYIHKVVFQTFRIQDSFLSRLQSKATVYPPNERIMANNRDENLWKAFKEELLLYAKKERWPVPKSRLRHTPGGKSYVVDDVNGDQGIFTKFTV